MTDDATIIDEKSAAVSDSTRREPASNDNAETTTPGENAQGAAADKAEGRESNDDDDTEYPTKLKLALITTALCLAVFCMALVCFKQQ